MVQADMLSSTDKCEHCTLRELNGGCQALQP